MEIEFEFEGQTGKVDYNKIIHQINTKRFLL